MDRSASPEARRAGLARMKDTLVTARLGLDDLRGGVAITRARLASEEQELATLRRRHGLAAGIGDAETVALAEKYALHHEKRAAVLHRKLDAQEAELAIAEREVGDMTAELRDAMAGLPGRAPHDAASGAASRAAPSPEERDDVASEIDALGHASARGARDAEADARLADLKRRMGK